MIPAYVLAQTRIIHCHQILQVPSEPTCTTTLSDFHEVRIEKCFEIGGN
jgi:hypothetical protein